MAKDNLIEIFDKAILVSLGIMIFSLPFSKSIIEISFMSALIFWTIKRIILHKEEKGIVRSFMPGNTTLSKPIGIFVFICFLSMITSVFLRLSLEGFFCKVFELVMVYFLITEVINDGKRLRFILATIAFSAALIAADGVFQFITKKDFIRCYVIYGVRLQASFFNANSFAGWLTVMIPLMLSMAYFSGSSWLAPTRMRNGIILRVMKFLFWLMTLILLFCLLMTYSRGAWLAVIFSIFFIGALKSKWLIAALAIILISLHFMAPASLKERAASVMKVSETDKFVLWGEALSIMEDFPLLGSGINTYAVVGPRYKLSEKSGFYPHNSYLQMAAESGILGLMAFGWLMLVLFKTSLASLKKIKNEFYASVLIGLLAGLAGFLVHSFFDTNFYTLQLSTLMWFIMGLLIAVQRVAMRW